jgi:hypothetical protein
VVHHNPFEQALAAVVEVLEFAFSRNSVEQLTQVEPCIHV